MKEATKDINIRWALSTVGSKGGRVKQLAARSSNQHLPAAKVFHQSKNEVKFTEVIKHTKVVTCDCTNASDVCLQIEDVSSVLLPLRLQSVLETLVARSDDVAVESFQRNNAECIRVWNRDLAALIWKLDWPQVSGTLQFDKRFYSCKCRCRDLCLTSRIEQI